MGDATESDRLVKRNLEQVPSPPPLSSIPKVIQSVVANLANSLLESGNFSDAEVICDGRAWKVHKLILRSGCVWFDKAFTNNWTEAQTGRIHVKEQQPERIDDLLKFIYSGRFTPKVASGDTGIWTPVLEDNVSLWQTADYFLLSSLKTEVYGYLLDRIIAVLARLHILTIRQTSSELISSNKRAVTIFITDFSKAVEKAYLCPTARDIHKLFANPACGLREHIPGPTLWDLMKTTGFQKDVYTALIALNFTQATKGRVVKPLAPSCDPTTNRYQCAQCGTGHLGKNHQRLIMVLDPFSQRDQLIIT